VPYRPDVHVRLGTVKFFLRHLFVPVFPLQDFMIFQD
jgi:hypothetical protein